MTIMKSSICNLRPVNTEDILRSLIWRNDDDVKRNLLSFRLPVTKPMEEAWVQKAMNGDTDRIIFSIEDETALHVGFIELNTIDYFSRNAYYAIVIGDKTARGKGIAKSATQLILEFAFNKLNLHKVCLQVAEYNHAAINIYKKIGFEQEGVLKEQLFMDGSYHQMICMGFFKQNLAEK